MKTFTGAPVPPVDEILERTLYVKTKNVEIERLTAERDAALAEAKMLRDELRAALAEVARLEAE